MSQIISRGLGGGAGIPQLILFRGLSPGALPPPPDVTEIEVGLIQLSETYYSFNAFSSVIFTDGTIFTLPARAVQITWQTIYGSVPAVADIVLQASLDGANWSTIDQSTEVNGEIRTLPLSARFIRAAMLDVTPGIVTSVLIRAQALEWLG